MPTEQRGLILTALPVETSRRAGVWFGHPLENSMLLDLIPSILATNGAMRTASLRGQAIAADGYYFGYWFSHRRA
jgi:hypothetical protein